MIQLVMKNGMTIPLQSQPIDYILVALTSNNIVVKDIVLSRSAESKVVTVSIQL